MNHRERLDTSEPVILFTINRTYRPNMTDSELYEASRKWWVVGEKRERLSTQSPSKR